jgi:hypothetical protein
MKPGGDDSTIVKDQHVTLSEVVHQLIKAPPVLYATGAPVEYEQA